MELGIVLIMILSIQNWTNRAHASFFECFSSVYNSELKFLAVGLDTKSEAMQLILIHTKHIIKD
jgi:hypothetical protein